MASIYPDDGNDRPPEEFAWPEMDMIENIIMDIKEYVKENKSGAHISIDIDFRTVDTSYGPTVTEKYSVGAASIGPSEEQQVADNKEIEKIIVEEMENSIPAGSEAGYLSLPAELAGASLEEQMQYIADKIKEKNDGGPLPYEPGLDGLKDDFMSFDRLMEFNKRNSGNGQQ